MLRLHGVPLSQPFRSVAWTLLQKRVPFEVSLCVPGSGGKRGSKGEAYLALNPLGTVPLLEDGPIKVVESAAILQYLSSKHGWTDLYPASLSDRARVDAFCHWHHGGTRQLAGGFYAPHVRPDMAEKFAKMASRGPRRMAWMRLTNWRQSGWRPIRSSPAPTRRSPT